LIAARAQRGISDSILSNDSDFSGRSSLVEGIFHERSPKATIKQAPFPTSRLRQIAYLSQSLAARNLALDLACPAQKWPHYLHKSTRGARGVCGGRFVVAGTILGYC
jgi:hypothetical protein